MSSSNPIIQAHTASQPISIQNQESPGHGQAQEHQFHSQTSGQNHDTRHTYSQIGHALTNGPPGAAFNTTPIYDAQGTLVGLQTQTDNNMLTEDRTSDNSVHNLGYVSVPSVYHYNAVQDPNGQFGCFEPNQYCSYSLKKDQHFAAPHQFAQYQTSFGNPQPLRRSPDLVTEPLEHTTGRFITEMPKNPRPRFDTCPALCSLLAILCCPITLWCSLPALVYSVCAYTDYRTADVERCQHKSDIARHLVITACVIGLLLCGTWAGATSNVLVKLKTASKFTPT